MIYSNVNDGYLTGIESKKYDIVLTSDEMNLDFIHRVFELGHFRRRRISPETNFADSVFAENQLE